jgi:hypothetical protein
MIDRPKCDLSSSENVLDIAGLDDVDDPDGLSALMHEVACDFKVLPFTVAPVGHIWAVLGTTSPLGPYSAIHFL